MDGEREEGRKERRKERKQRDNIRNLPITMLILPTWPISSYQSDVIGNKMNKIGAQIGL